MTSHFAPKSSLLFLRQAIAYLKPLHYSRYSKLLVGLGLFALLAQPIATPAAPAPLQVASSITQPDIPPVNQTIFVHPSSGNDATADGSERSPFRSLTQALNFAQPNTLIVLAPGIYSVESGEQFPLQLKPQLKIQGDPTNKGQFVIIRGGGEFISPTSARQDATMIGADQVELSGVTITNPNSRGYGLWLESSSPVVVNNTFTGNTHDGISTVGNSSPVIWGNLFVRNGANGVTLYGSGQPEVRENIFENTGYAINISQTATPVIVSNRISRNRAGVIVQQSARPLLRSNVIEECLEDGLVAIAQSYPDLGTANDPGKNSFRNNRRYDINTYAAKNIIPAFGNEVLTTRVVGELDWSGTATAPVAATPVTTPRSTAITILRNPQPAQATQPGQASIRPLAAVAPAAPAAPVAPSPASRTNPAAARPAPDRTAAPSTLNAIVPVSGNSANSATAQSPSTGATSGDTARTRRTLATRNQAAGAANGAAIAPPTSPALNIPVPRPARRTSPARQSIAVEIPVPAPERRSRLPVAGERDRITTPPSAVAAPLLAAAPSPQAAAIQIEVPPPASRSITSQRQQMALAALTERSQSGQQRQPIGDVLPVPRSEIPVGNAGGRSVEAFVPPGVQGGVSQFVGSVAMTAAEPAQSLRYRVVVEARGRRTEEKVRSLVPNAFTSVLDGRSVYQVGAFGDRTNAEALVDRLERSGLNASVEAMQ